MSSRQLADWEFVVYSLHRSFTSRFTAVT